jgi:hypothetical protein
MWITLTKGTSFSTEGILDETMTVISIMRWAKGTRAVTEEDRSMSCQSRTLNREISDPVQWYRNYPRSHFTRSENVRSRWNVPKIYFLQGRRKRCRSVQEGPKEWTQYISFLLGGIAVVNEHKLPGVSVLSLFIMKKIGNPIPDACTVNT